MRITIYDDDDTELGTFTLPQEGAKEVKQGGYAQLLFGELGPNGFTFGATYCLPLEGKINFGRYKATMARFWTFAVSITKTPPR